MNATAPVYGSFAPGQQAAQWWGWGNRGVVWQGGGGSADVRSQAGFSLTNHSWGQTGQAPAQVQQSPQQPPVQQVLQPQPVTIPAPSSQDAVEAVKRQLVQDMLVKSDEAKKKSAPNAASSEKAAPSKAPEKSSEKIAAPHDMSSLNVLKFVKVIGSTIASGIFNTFVMKVDPVVAFAQSFFLNCGEIFFVSQLYNANSKFSMRLREFFNGFTDGPAKKDFTEMNREEQERVLRPISAFASLIGTLGLAYYNIRKYGKVDKPLPEWLLRFPQLAELVGNAKKLISKKPALYFGILALYGVTRGPIETWVASLISHRENKHSTEAASAPKVQAVAAQAAVIPPAASSAP